MIKLASDCLESFTSTLDSENFTCKSVMSSSSSTKMKEVFMIILFVSKSNSEGYYFESNETSFSSYPVSEVTSVSGPFRSFETLNFYRSDIRKREPQFLGFDIQDDNIEVQMLAAQSGSLC